MGVVVSVVAMGRRSVIRIDNDPLVPDLVGIELLRLLQYIRPAIVDHTWLDGTQRLLANR